MNELPKGWANARIADLLKIRNGFAFKSADFCAEGVPLIRQSELKCDRIDVSGAIYLPRHFLRKYNNFIIEKGDILIGMSGSLGKVSLYVSDKPALQNQRTGLLVVEEQVADKAFALYALKYVEPQILEQGKGIAVQNISPSQIESCDLLLPPRAEQTRIVAKLEELLSDLDAGVAELKAAQKKLAQYRQSLLKAAVEGALTAEWREARRNSPSPQPLSRQGRGVMATGVLNDTGMLTPLPPCGGGVGGEGAKARQVTSPIQQQHARELRSHQTPTERDLWQQLRAKRFAGFKFRRQQPLGRYIVDFVCFEQRLIVELDGSQHADQQDYDAERDAWLQAQGFRVLRFWNNQWSAQPEAVLEAIWVGLQQEPPLPNPSPARGEGLETGAQLLERILIERRARWEAKQLAKFAEQGKTPPKDWQKKYPEPVQPDTTDLPELPQGWVWASLDALIEDGPQNGLYLPASQYGHGTPILRIDDYQIGWHRARTALNLVDADEKTIEVYALNVGDLVINRVNSMTHLGKSLCINEAMAGVLFESNMMRLHLFGSVNADYVTFYLGSGLGRERLTSDAKWAVNQASINQQDIRKTPIPLPPQAEQRQIVELLSSQHEAMERQSAAIGIAFKQSAAQRQNILRAAFAGQLVPQDPNDEPASVLLERIRAERAAVKKPRGRKTKEANHAR